MKARAKREARRPWLVSKMRLRLKGRNMAAYYAPFRASNRAHALAPAFIFRAVGAHLLRL